MGCQHSGSHEAGSLTASPTDHLNLATLASQLMRDGQSHQPSAEHKNRFPVALRHDDRLIRSL